MSLLNKVLSAIGIGSAAAPARRRISVFLLDDDTRRHDWFNRRFSGDTVDIAETASHAIEILSQGEYDAIFLDHDLLPEHYHSEKTDDERTGYAVARWLAANPQHQSMATITVHTRNADGALRMVELLRRAGRPIEYIPFPLLSQKIKNQWQR